MLDARYFFLLQIYRKNYDSSDEDEGNMMMLKNYY